MNANQLLSIFYMMGSKLGRADWMKRRKHWTGEQLREIRRRNGVGRPPAVMLARQSRDAWRKRCGHAGTSREDSGLPAGYLIPPGAS